MALPFVAMELLPSAVWKNSIVCRRGLASGREAANRVISEVEFSWKIALLRVVDARTGLKIKGRRSSLNQRAWACCLCEALYEYKNTDI